MLGIERTASEGEIKVAYRKLALVRLCVHACVLSTPPDTTFKSPSHPIHQHTHLTSTNQKWHPDKNLGNAEATAVFQQIQEAHSVLSDARERSWYDSHRDEILRGDDGGDDNGDGGYGYVVNVWPYFSGAAFTGYGDGAGGFYEVYRGVFEVRVDVRECVCLGLCWGVGGG